MFFTSRRASPRRTTRSAACRLQVERLEDRDCPSGGYLLVPDYVNENVLRFDAATGAFVDEFIPRHSGGLNQPNGIVFGPHDHDLYITTGHFQGPGQIKSVLRFDGATGAFADEFVHRRQLDQAHSGIFGPDGNLYVADSGNNPGGIHSAGGRIARFNGLTGDFLDDFVPAGSGGLTHPGAIVFGPDATGDGRLDLYATDEGPSRVMLYNGVTGVFVREFVTSGSGSLRFAWGLTFGPDGNLYVASIGTRSVMRYQAPSGPTPGAPLPSPGNSGAYFVSAGSGGLLDTLGVLFGPDGNGDGRQDLYVTSNDFYNQGFINSKDGSVRRYDGQTGAFLDTFVPTGSGRLRSTVLITFTETDPVTLAYRGGSLMASAPPSDPVQETLRADQVQPLLTEALTRWQAVSALTRPGAPIDVRIADLGGATLGQVVGQTIWLDDDAAGWGWFVDPTPWDDAEFTTPGDQGETGRMDLLSVLLHEIGHALGHDHAEDGVMAETLSAGTRSALGHGLDADWAWLGGDAFFDPPTTVEGLPWPGKNRRKG